MAQPPMECRSGTTRRRNVVTVDAGSVTGDRDKMQLAILKKSCYYIAVQSTTL